MRIIKASQSRIVGPPVLVSDHRRVLVRGIRPNNSQDHRLPNYNFDGRTIVRCQPDPVHSRKAIEGESVERSEQMEHGRRTWCRRSVGILTVRTGGNGSRPSHEIVSQ